MAETFLFPPLETMDPQALKDFLADIQAQIAALDQSEPADMESEAFEDWAQRHEELEDLADDVMDRLESLT
jgi:hypothetical protein